MKSVVQVAARDKTFVPQQADEYHPSVRTLSAVLVLIALLVMPVTVRAATAPPTVSATEVAVIDGPTGQLLFGKNANELVYPASLTKMATGLIAIEMGTLSEVVTVQTDPNLSRFSTVMGLSEGMQVTLEDLLYGLLLPSGNDAAIAIGRHIAVDDATFVGLMNARMRWMGLTQTNFVNAHGLDRDGHQSTAYELSMLAREAMSNPTFAKIAGTGGWTANMNGPAPLYNLNRLLGRYAGADGVKVGYTRRSGPALAASATRNGVRMFVVVLHSSDPPTDSARLLDWAFANRASLIIAP